MNVEKYFKTCYSVLTCITMDISIIIIKLNCSKFLEFATKGKKIAIAVCQNTKEFLDRNDLRFVLYLAFSYLMYVAETAKQHETKLICEKFFKYIIHVFSLQIKQLKMDDSSKIHASALEVALFVYPQIMTAMINNKWSPKDIATRIKKDKGQTFLKKLSNEANHMISQLERSGFVALDISCLYQVIRYFGLLASPKQGWGEKPNSNDRGKADDVERMKNFRNNVIHCPQGGLSESERAKFFKESIEIAERMDKRIGSPTNGFKSKIEKVQSDTVSSGRLEILGKCPKYEGRLTTIYLHN